MKVFDIIRFEGTNDVFVWKFPGEDFNTLSQLIVHESQEAIFFKDGQALDIFAPGRYTLHTQNIPLIRRVVNIPFNGVSPFHCEVYFINKVVSMDITWATPEKMPLMDGKYNFPASVSASGQFGVRVVDGKRLLINLVGAISKFDQETLKTYFKGIMLTGIKDHIAKAFAVKRFSVFEIQSHLKEISSFLRDDLSNEFIKYGIELVNFNVSNIVPDEKDPQFLRVKNALAKKSEMDIMGYNYQQERTYNLLDKAASNQGSSSSIMNAGMGLAMGFNVGKSVGTAMESITPNVASAESVTNKDTQKCIKCGAILPNNAKFCLNCGQNVEETSDNNMVKCGHCGELVPKGKFCLSCGCKLNVNCPKCGAELIQGAKFCLECGTKVE